MLFDDTYLTIKQNAESLFSDRGSKFIAYAYQIRTETDVKPLVAQLKAIHPKANHHCWAVRLGPDRTVFKVNDDGEPSGTAGRPMLNVLLSKNVTDTLVVVVRYFGGKLLGVPGLINAYKTATEQVLTEAGTIEKVITDVYTLTFEYPQMNDVMRIIKEEDLQVLEQTADLRCALKIAIRKSKVNQTIGRFEGISNIHIQYYIGG
ncbi:YigZ family protein [Mucilaginibacter sp. Bleaf8]|uniref:IMPACT family protein n=1 Tax=Mucilaginibacter sp. Bleaf8 TaxID=2834430 RepID=UPI001BCF589B|nr:YigZ family protein [Mucilaginibacter sp. Bleaf8]MBS7563127.1 YigZ family protein [Mucilaginibacter sp. Bleaf8]